MKAGLDHLDGHDMAAAEFAVIDVIARLLQCAGDTAPAACDRQNRIFPPMGDEEPWRVLRSGQRNEPWRKRQNIADELTIDEAERKRIRGAVGKARKCNAAAIHG